MEERHKQFISSLIVFLTVVISFVYLLCVSWYRWGDLIVDTFRDFWVSSQLLEGKVLYKDIFYEYGFLPPYFLALIFKLFGVHINPLVLCGIGVTILVSILLYKISRFFLDEMVSGLVVLTFLFVFAFNHYFYNGIFNFILPYSFASIFFILFVSSALFFFFKFIFFEKGIYLVFWSISLSFAFFSRVDTPLLIWGAFFLVGGIFILKSKHGICWRWGLYLFLPLFIGFLGYLLFLFKMEAWDGFKECTIGHILEVKDNIFNKSVMGFDNLPRSIFLIAISFLSHLIIIFSLSVSSLIISSFFWNREKTRFILILGVLLIYFIFLFAKKYMGFLQYRCMPLVLGIGISISLIKIFYLPDFKKNLSLLLLFLISLLMILRIFLNTNPFGYGFYLLNLGLICYYIFFFGIFKEILQRHFKDFSEPLFSSILICLFVFLISFYWIVSRSMYKHKNVKVITERGRIFCFDNFITQRYWKAVSYIKKNTAEDDKVVVVPEGVGINFFSSRENPLKYFNFIPPIFRFIDEEKMVSEFAESGIDYIVIVQRTTFEYGPSFFGIHYGRKLYSWILNNYQLVKLFGPYPFTTNEFGVAIFKKR
jgi:hypothetical protein